MCANSTDAMHDHNIHVTAQMQITAAPSTVAAVVTESRNQMHVLTVCFDSDNINLSEDNCESVSNSLSKNEEQIELLGLKSNF